MSTKNFSPIGPAVWPVIGNIYINVLFYYIDLFVFEKFVQNIDNPGLFLTHPVYLFVAAGQRAGLNCLKFLEGTLGHPIFFLFHMERPANPKVCLMFTNVDLGSGQSVLSVLLNIYVFSVFRKIANCKILISSTLLLSN